MASSVRVLVLAVLILLPARLLAAVPAAGSDAPDAAWRQGPVRYILIVKEDLAYKVLGTDEKRAAFIETFWAALDPTPGTEANERRVEFWKRVDAANRMFREGLQAGWRTDRGKFYILLGPPDERHAPGPWEEWKYVALPNPEADPEVMIRFRRNSEGEYHVGRTELEYWDPSQESDGPAAGDTFLAVRTKGGTRQMMKGRLRMTEFPEAGVQADFLTAPLEHRFRCDFYRVKKKSTRVVVTLALPKGQFRGAGGGFQAPDMTLSVAVDDARKGKPVGDFSESMQIAGGASMLMDRPVVLQGSFTIEPGTYKAVFTIVDRKSHRGVSRTETIEAPDFGRGLALSSIAVGRVREEPPAAGSPGDAGGATLIPEPDTTFRPGETILFAYEVYNASHGGGTKPDLDVQYEFIVETEGGPRQAGKPVSLKHQASEALGYSLPLQGWPEAAYRVRVKVTDNRSGATAEREASFLLAR
jgi:GWxTD domain-containing protein